MEQAFWLQRWQKGETGFHQDSLNPHLKYYYDDKAVPLEERKALKVFVPLCGKSLDMYWLSQNGYEVLGIECSPIAVVDFFKNHKLEYQLVESGAFTRYIAEGDNEGRRRIEILLGDFFDLSPKDLEGVTEIYDRASMIALPEAMRLQYSQKMAQLQRPGMRTLLITLTYPQAETAGPPFSVTEEEVREFYGKHFKVEKLRAKDILAEEPRFQQRGVSSLIETAYKLTRN
jgi:thiopurine S-methyltransferase